MPPTNRLEASNEKIMKRRLFPVFQAAKPTTTKMRINIAPTGYFDWKIEATHFKPGGTRERRDNEDQH